MAEQGPPGGGGVEPEDPEAGRPIEVLAEMRYAPPADFFERVRLKIDRKMLAADIADLTWRAPLLLLMQWMLMFVELLRPGGRSRGEESDE